MQNSLNEKLEQPSDRVRDHSSQLVNRRIAERTQDRVQRVVSQGHDAIVERLTQLDREWDVDRALMVNFAIAGGTAYAVGLQRYASSPWFGRRRKGFLYFFAAQLGFLLLHGTVGWCPPLPVFRRLGVRTKSEIESERHTLLKALGSDTPS